MMASTALLLGAIAVACKDGAPIRREPSAATSAQPVAEGLHVYGPGGPLAPMKECAERYGAAHHVAIDVVGGPEPEWLERAAQDADVVFGGAEYMLSDFVRRHPGFVDEATRVSLYERPAAILVRKGNPKHIVALGDLARAGVHLLDVEGAGQTGLWEDVAGRAGLIAPIAKNIVVTTTTTKDGIAAWKSRPDIDAWISFASWHERLKDETDVVPLDSSIVLYRGTPIAIASATKHRALSAAWIAYLESPEAHEIFRRWGWR